MFLFDQSHFVLHSAMVTYWCRKVKHLKETCVVKLNGTSVLRTCVFVWTCSCQWQSMLLSIIIYLQSLKWIVPTCIMLGASPCYMTVWASWRALTAILPRRYYRFGDDVLYSSYQRFILFFFENITGVEVIERKCSKRQIDGMGNRSSRSLSELYL